MIPASGWLPDNVVTDEPVILAPLPVKHTLEYRAGTAKALTKLIGIRGTVFFDGYETYSMYHGLSEDDEYGIVVKVDRNNAYGAALVDTLDIPEILSDAIFIKESCPDVTVEDLTQDDVIVDSVKETCPDVTSEVIEPSLPSLSLTSFEACCGVLNVAFADGSYLADGTLKAS